MEHLARKLREKLRTTKPGQKKGPKAATTKGRNGISGTVVAGNFNRKIQAHALIK